MLISHPKRDDLPLVMQEICDALGAMTAVLTLRSSDGCPPEILYLDHPALDGEAVAPLIAEDGPDAEADGEGGETYGWLSCNRATECWDVLSMSVKRISGHGQLTISAFFSDPSGEKRQAAEEVYLQRRPFAVGYFRLWQMDRIRSRQTAGLEEALNLSNVGTILVDRERRILFANTAAAALLDQSQGVRRHGGTIGTVKMSDAVRLQVGLEHVIGENGAQNRNRRRSAPMMAIRREGGAALILSVMPVHERAAEPSDVAAIVYIHEPFKDINRLMQPVCKLYGLSPTETRLSCLLASGTSLSDAAASMKVAEQTARGYLKSIFAKTDTHRQIDLIRLMLSSLLDTVPTIIPEVI